MFKNLRIRSKLFLTYGIMMIFYLITVVAAFVGLNSVANGLERFYETPYPMVYNAMKVQSATQEIQLDLFRAYSADETQLTSILSSIEEAAAQRSDSLDSLKACYEGDASALQSIENAGQRTASARQEAVSLLKSGDKESAIAIIGGEYMEACQELYALLDETIQGAEATATEYLNSGMSVKKLCQTAFFALSIVCVIFALLLIVRLIQAMTRPIAEIENAVKALRDMPAIPKTRLISQTADIHIENAGISHTEREMRTADIENSYQILPDLITSISDETLLTPATVNEILIRSGRLDDFLNNPETFLEKATEIIKNNRHMLAIDGISYIKLDGQEYYAQEIFDTEEFLANLDRNAVKVDHSVYDYIVYDSSSIERPFAIALDNDPDVKMFFKIPDRFKIETPIGTYNPDWAVYLTKNGEEKLYFVLETKGSTSFMDLRTREQLKIHCGKKHFEALDNGIELQVATDWNKLKSIL